MQNAYFQHAQHCQRLAAECGTPEARRLRLREARDWLALAAAHEQAPEDKAWTPLNPLNPSNH